jgi:LPXTG-motif cell wall-anchored protein
VPLPLAVPSPTATGPAIVDQSGSAPQDGSSGSPTGLIVGLILVVGLGSAGGLVAWRRRRTSP